MRKLRAVFIRLTGLFNRRCRAREFDAELESNLQMHIEDNLRSGMSPEEARYAALRKFGNVMRVKEEAWELWGFVWLEQLWQDARYGVRMLAKNPGFSILAALTLALGIGASTAIFSVVNAVLLRPLPYSDPGRLMWITQYVPALRSSFVLHPYYRAWRDQSNSLASVAAYVVGAYSLKTDKVGAERVVVTRVSQGFLEQLGTHPEIGRFFGPEACGNSPPIVLAHGFWERRFGGDRGILGQLVTLEWHPFPFTIVGVLPATFEFPGLSRLDVILPLCVDPAAERTQGFMNVNVIGRLKPGVTPAAARAELETLVDRTNKGVLSVDGANAFVGPFAVVPLHDHLVGSVRLALMMLFGAVGFLLLIACGNVANMLLARAAARDREIVIRTAVGAGRGRIVRQLLTESLVLAAVGGGLGLIFACVGTPALVRAAASDAVGEILRAARVGIDREVLGFTLLASVITAILFGMAPALSSARTGVVGSLKDYSPTAAAGVSRRRIRSLLVVTEIALALVMLTGAGLLMRSFHRLVSIDPGFRPEGVLTFTITLGNRVIASPGPRREYFDEIQHRVGALPGVESVSVAEYLPFSAAPVTQVGLPEIEGASALPSGALRIVSQAFVSPEYFRTMGLTVLAGRAFNAEDDRQSAPVALINQALARQLFSGQSAVGKRYKTYTSPHDFVWTTIIGVVSDVHDSGLNTEPQPEVYSPLWQRDYPMPYAEVAIRTAGDPAALTAAVRGVVASIEKDQAIYDFITMQDRVATSLSSPRFTTLLMGVFAVLALSLAAVGIYGVTAYSVAQRAHEIGVRVALGARPMDVLVLLVREGVEVISIGIGLGIAGALALTHLLRSLLFKISPYDPMTLVVMAAGLALVAALACFVPARRATKLDPTVALRYE